MRQRKSDMPFCEVGLRVQKYEFFDFGFLKGVSNCECAEGGRVAGFIYFSCLQTTSSKFGAGMTRRRIGNLGKLLANSVSRLMRADRPPKVTAPRRLAGSELTSQVPRPRVLAGPRRASGLVGGTASRGNDWADIE